ncbi:PepSY domain-containing protein [Brevibacillus laterosporus]|uniref:PepSY-associated TM helix domain-containing protein n=1 Tax=Brevibacillus laterosporus TaxID=1465 RepID=UPI0018CF81B5|nr:PepSY domain-containing protein [Brevibacillus laterosporus]MCR8937024.1 PepSY domain-containing protein [Brevibacillus laterosporus]MCZ0839662.1 PepSY domain-containing protein [Brevibacillus laterosporus]MCZ0844769.1 PepSY domain-containing protein [Brevibacillus laterosporus]MED1910361.1 PepSY domain-containing protein [Brevibacillus laterosporus]
MNHSTLEKSASHESLITKKHKSALLYQMVWRWHFYAGLLFSPFLIVLAFSGAVYLFKPQIEAYLYQHLYQVQEVGQQALPVSKQMEIIKEQYPNQTITALTFYDDPSRTTEVMTMGNNQMISIFIDPYRGVSNGTLQVDEKFTEIIKKLHSELIIGGTIANRLVELAACWAVILLVTGLYLWWPRNKASIWGTILPRLHKKGKLFWRDLHAVPAFWLSILILMLILTGLPWSGVMGEGINQLATSTKTGYPSYSFSFGEKPESIVKTKDVAKDVPWAAENLPVPQSLHNQYVPLSLENVMWVAEQQNITKPYTISLPQNEKGVYTLTTAHTKPGQEATLHIDQYTGMVLSEVRYSDYGLLAKGITLGIALHEGRLFGWANQLIGLVACLGLIGIVVSSFIMWWKRKPEGKWGAPSKPKQAKITKMIFFLMVIMGLCMPLVGISLIVVFLFDRFVILRVKAGAKDLHP